MSSGVDQAWGRVTAARYSRMICRLIRSRSGPCKALEDRAPGDPGLRSFRNPARYDDVGVNEQGGLLSAFVAVDLLAAAAESLRPGPEVVGRENVVDREPPTTVGIGRRMRRVSCRRTLTPHKDQRLRFHVHGFRPPSRGHPREGVAVTAAPTGIRPPRPVNARGTRKAEAEDSLEFRERRAPFVPATGAQVRVERCVLAARRRLTNEHRTGFGHRIITGPNKNKYLHNPGGTGWQSTTGWRPPLRCRLSPAVGCRLGRFSAV